MSLRSYTISAKSVAALVINTVRIDTDGAKTLISLPHKKRYYFKY